MPSLKGAVAGRQPVTDQGGNAANDHQPLLTVADVEAACLRQAGNATGHLPATPTAEMNDGPDRGRVPVTPTAEWHDGPKLDLLPGPPRQGSLSSRASSTSSPLGMRHALQAESLQGMGSGSRQGTESGSFMALEDQGTSEARTRTDSLPLFLEDRSHMRSGSNPSAGSLRSVPELADGVPDDRPVALRSGSNPSAGSNSQLSPHSPGNSRSALPDSPQVRTPETDAWLTKVRSGSEWTSEGEDDLSGSEGDENLWYIKAPGPVPLALLSVLWMFAAGAVLIAAMALYSFEEVRGLEHSAMRAAVSSARVQATQVILPLFHLAQSVDVAVRNGYTNNSFDYERLIDVLEPHFAGVAQMKEVMVMNTHPDKSGNALVTRDYVGKLQLHSDHNACGTLRGDKACALAPLAHKLEKETWTNQSQHFYVSSWHADTPEMLWLGPFFIRNNRHEISCERFCWTLSLGLATRVPGELDRRGLYWDGDGIPSTTTLTTTLNPDFDPRTGEEWVPYPGPVLRISLAASALQPVVQWLANQTFGQVFICSAQGALLAAENMTDTLHVDKETGAFQAAKITSLSHGWSSAITPELLKEAAGASVLSGNIRVSVWELNGTLPGLGDSFRIVLAIPEAIFIDPYLGNVVYLSIALGAVPWALAAVVVLLCLARRFSPPALTFAVKRYCKCCVRAPKAAQAQSTD